MQQDMTFEAWEAALEALTEGLVRAVRGALTRAQGDHQRSRALAMPVGQGAGDVTFGMDAPAEEFMDEWLLEQARQRPLSLLTEDRGWRHMGPAPGRSGEAQDLPGFNHGGPRIAVDPVDGTRNLMAGLRSAWTVVSFAAAGPGQPSYQDQCAGIVAELPTLRAAHRSTYSAAGDGCWRLDIDVASGQLLERRRLRVDAEARADHGYFPFFRFEPKFRPLLAQLEAAFFARLELHEGSDPAAFYDDQYISNAGQLVQLIEGTYRMLVDARALLAERLGQPAICSKPYDLAGALFCARAAGVALGAADGSPLEFPIDTDTPVHLAAYANAATRERLEPHWLAVVQAGF